MEIKEIYNSYEKYLDKEICVSGWIRKHRKQKEIGFIEISDGTCLKTLQIVYEEKQKDFEGIQKIHFGSCIKVYGILGENSREELELKSTKIEIIGDCKEDYPIQPKKHTREFLREQAYLRPRTTLFTAIFRIRSVVSMAIHEYFQSRGFLYVHAPILTASDCEGAGEMF